MTNETISRVLVVDVDDELRNAICEILDDAGFRASCVPDVDAARSRLKSAPDVLLLCWDVHAGAEDKKALLDDVPDETAIVIMSTHPSVARVAAELGVPFVTKPFGIEDFIATITRASHPPPRG